MYTIILREDGKFQCVCRVQDGTEEFVEDTLEKAIHETIKAARVMNNSYITSKDIDIRSGRPTCFLAPVEHAAWIDEVRRGIKVLLDYDDKRVKYRITDEECDLIVKIREGDARVSNV